VTVPQPDTVSVVGFVAIPVRKALGFEPALLKLSVRAVPGVTVPDEANVNVNFELTAPVVDWLNDAVNADSEAWTTNGVMPDASVPATSAETFAR